LILLLGLDSEVFITPPPDGPQRKNEVSLVEAKVLGVVVWAKPACKAECTDQHTDFVHKVMTMCAYTHIYTYIQTNTQVQHSIKNNKCR